jgi:dolichol-phosphate mannosyltransferase
MPGFCAQKLEGARLALPTGVVNMSSHTLKVAVVVPTFNEDGMIKTIVQGVIRTGLVSWIVVVDDSSTDDTVDIVRSLQLADRRVQLIVRQGRRRSFAKSYIEGFRHALDLGAEAIVQMDGDGSHDPGDIPRVVDALRSSDVVVCSRYAAGGRNNMCSQGRLLLSHFGSRFSQTVLGIPVRDMTGGFNGWNATTIRGIRFDENWLEGFGFQVWLKWKAYTNHATFKELPIVFEDRKTGFSKFRFAMATEVLAGIVRMRFETARSRDRLDGRLSSIQLRK